MFDKLYASVDSKIMPSDELIQKTKAKMYKELKHSSRMNFYRYSAIAACIVVVIAIFNMLPEFSTTNDMAMSAPMQHLESGIPSDSLTDSAKTGSSKPINFVSNAAPASSTNVASNPATSFFESIFNILKNIIQWLKELLF